MRRHLFAALAALLAVGIGSSAWAVSVGLNFVSDRETGAAIAPNEFAGVGPASQMNWNNTAPVPSPGDQRPVSGTTADITGPMPGVLVDNTGAATSISVNWSGNNSWNTNNGTSNGDNKLMNGYLDNAGGVDSVVSFSDIPYQYYDVVAYFGSDGNGRTGVITDGSTSYSFSTFSQQGGQFPQMYVQTTDTAGGNPDANFAVFQAKSDSDLTLTLPNAGGNKGFHGVQILEKTTGNVLAGRIANVGGKVGGAALELNLDTDTATGADVPWRIRQIATTPTVGGLLTEWYHQAGVDSRAEVDDFLATNPTPSIAPFQSLIAWEDGNASFPYPQPVIDAGLNTGDDRVVRYTGEIFIPESGTYRFKDGIDQSTLLNIDGMTVIDDSQWTGFNGTGGDNGGSPISIVDLTVDAGGEWVPIEFTMGEVCCGDQASLYWDYLPVDPNDPSAGGTINANPGFPFVFTDPAGVEALVAPGYLRSFLVNELSGTGQIGDALENGVFMDAQGNMLVFDPNANYELIVGPFNGLPAFTTTEFEAGVPEPATGMLALLGVAAIGVRRRRRAA